MINYRIFLGVLPYLLLLVIVGCTDNTSGPEETDAEISEEVAVGTLVDFLEDRDLISDFVSNKGITTDEVSTNITNYINWDVNDSGTPVMKLWLGPNDQLIPNPEWQDVNKNACKNEYSYMKGGIKLLNIKIHTSVKEVTIQYIDIETGVIEKEQMGQGDGQNWLYDAIDKAWDKFTYLPIEPAGDPCGEEIKLKIKFNSEIEANPADGLTTFDHVTAEFELTFLEAFFDDDAYEGEGNLHWIEYTSSVDGTCNPPDGRMKILSLTLPGINEEASDADGIEMILQFDDMTLQSECLPYFPVGWLTIHFDEADGTLDMDPIAYVIKDWEKILDFNGVIAQKTYDRSETLVVDGESFTYTEYTTIKILHNPDSE